MSSLNSAYFDAIHELQNQKNISEEMSCQLSLCRESLRKYPLPIEDVKHCKILQGFDQQMVDLIAEILQTKAENKRKSPTDILNLSLSPISKRSHPGEPLKKKKCKEKDGPIVIDQRNDNDKFVVSDTKMSSQEEEDMEFARRLSQELNGDHVERQSQEDKDFQLALKLHEENYAVEILSHSRSVPVSSRPSDVFADDDFDENDSKILRLLNEPNGSKNGEDQVRTVVTPPPVTPEKEASSPKPAKSLSLSSVFSQDPVFARWSKESVDEDKQSNKKQNKKTNVKPAITRKVHEMSSSSDTDTPVIVEPEASSREADKFSDPVPSTSARLTKAAKPLSGGTHCLSSSEDEAQERIPSRKVTKTQSKKKACGKKLPTKPKKKEAKDVLLSEEEIPQWYTEGKSNSIPIAATMPRDDHVAAFTLEPGQFEVFLVVDNMEVVGGNHGGKKSRKELTIKELRANGVPFETRHLNVGDFTWIAKEIVPFVPDQLRQPQPRELVLPYVVERKRMDDLRRSIVDGRYKEQKLRLGQCGLPNIIYLIEDFGKNRKHWAKESEGRGFHLKALDAAVTSTAVTEGFTVRLTDDQRESMTYLTLLTRHLREEFHPLRLTSCTKDDMSNGLIANVKTTLLTFTNFNDESKKRRALTQSEVFSRMLCQQHGVTPTIAIAITEKYATLGDLVRAYERCQDEEERETMLLDIEYEDGKKIKKGVSQVIAWLYNEKDLK